MHVYKACIVIQKKTKAHTSTQKRDCTVDAGRCGMSDSSASIDGGNLSTDLLPLNVSSAVATNNIPSDIALLEAAIDHYPPLNKALIDNDWERALSIVSEGADVAAMDPNGKAPLLLACFLGRADVVRAILLRMGDDDERRRVMNQTEGRCPCTALHWAIRGGHSECALTLIAAGCDLESVDDEGNTALHLACQVGLVDVVSALVLRGADVWAARPDDGATPLEDAVAKHYSDCVGILVGVLESGGSCDQRRSMCPTCEGPTHSSLGLAVHLAMECPSPPRKVRKWVSCCSCGKRFRGAVGLAVHKMRSDDCGRTRTETQQRQK